MGEVCAIEVCPGTLGMDQEATLVRVIAPSGDCQGTTCGAGAVFARSMLRFSTTNMRACMIHTMTGNTQLYINRSNHRGRAA